MNYPFLGASALALAVVLGAFGAHGLKDRLDAYSMGIWEKAVFYHFVHAFGILVVPILARVGAITEAQSGRVCLLLVAGVVLFSGSLYILAVSGIPVLGAITPLGGVSFIAAWLMLAWALLGKTPSV